MDLKKVVCIVALTVISVVTINYLLIFTIPVHAEEYANKGEELPTLTIVFLDVIESLKYHGLIFSALLALPFVLCIKFKNSLIRNSGWLVIGLLYLLPIFALYGLPSLGYPGKKIEMEVVEPEELLKIPVFFEPPETERFDVDYFDETVRHIIKDIRDSQGLNIYGIDKLPKQRTSIKLREVTWQQVIEVTLEPIEFTYTYGPNGVELFAYDELLEEEVVGVAFPLYGSFEEIRDALYPLIDSANGGKVYHDKIRNMIIVFERQSRMNDIAEIYTRYRGSNL